MRLFNALTPATNATFQTHSVIVNSNDNKNKAKEESLLTPRGFDADKLAHNVRSADVKGDQALKCLSLLIADQGDVLQERVLVLEKDGQVISAWDPLDTAKPAEFEALEVGRQARAVRIQLEPAHYSTTVNGEKKSIDIKNGDSFFNMVLAAANGVDPAVVSSEDVRAFREKLATHVLSPESSVAHIWAANFPSVDTDFSYNAGPAGMRVSEWKKIQEDIRQQPFSQRLGVDIVRSDFLDTGIAKATTELWKTNIQDYLKDQKLTHDQRIAASALSALWNVSPSDWPSVLQKENFFAGYNGSGSPLIDCIKEITALHQDVNTARTSLQQVDKDLAIARGEQVSEGTIFDLLSACDEGTNHLISACCDSIEMIVQQHLPQPLPSRISDMLLVLFQINDASKSLASKQDLVKEALASFKYLTDLLREFAPKREVTLIRGKLHQIRLNLTTVLGRLDQASPASPERIKELEKRQNDAQQVVKSGLEKLASSDRAQAQRADSKNGVRSQLLHRLLELDKRADFYKEVSSPAPLSMPDSNAARFTYFLYLFQNLGGTSVMQALREYSGALPYNGHGARSTSSPLDDEASAEQLRVDIQNEFDTEFTSRLEGEIRRFELEVSGAQKEIVDLKSNLDLTPEQSRRMDTLGELIHQKETAINTLQNFQYQSVEATSGASELMQRLKEISPDLHSFATEKPSIIKTWAAMREMEILGEGKMSFNQEGGMTFTVNRDIFTKFFGLSNDAAKMEAMLTGAAPKNQGGLGLDTFMPRGGTNKAEPQHLAGAAVTQLNVASTPTNNQMALNLESFVPREGTSWAEPGQVVQSQSPVYSKPQKGVATIPNRSHSRDTLSQVNPRSTLSLFGTSAPRNKVEPTQLHQLFNQPGDFEVCIETPNDSGSIDIDCTGEVVEIHIPRAAHANAQSAKESATSPSNKPYASSTTIAVGAIAAAHTLQAGAASQPLIPASTAAAVATPIAKEAVGLLGQPVNSANSIVVPSGLGGVIQRHPIKTIAGVATVIGASVVGIVKAAQYLSSSQPEIFPEQVKEEVLNLLTHTTHDMPVGDDPVQSTADKVKALMEQYGDAPNDAALQSEIIQVLKMDGVFEAVQTALGLAAGTERLSTSSGGVQAFPVGFDDFGVAKALIDIMKGFYNLNTEIAEALDKQDEQFFLQILQEQWRKDSNLTWLANASEEQQKNWLQLNHNRQYASEKVNQYVQAPQKEMLNSIQDNLKARGLGSLTAEHVTLSTTRNAQGQSIPTNITLAEFARRGIPSDIRSPWLAQDVVVYIEDENGVKQANVEDAQNIRHVLQDAKRKQVNYIQEIDRIRTSETGQDAYHRYLLDDFYLAMLTAQLQGTLTGGRDAYIKGLDIIDAARRDDPKVSVGTFTLTLGGITVPIRNWLVLVKYDERHQEDGVVLYNAEQNKWGLYNNQAEISQHLDLTRLVQTVGSTDQKMPGGQINVKTIPLWDAALNNVENKDRSKLAQLLNQLVERPDLWKNDQLAFTPFPNRGFNEGMKQFSEDLYNKNLLDIIAPLRENPSLMQHADDNRLLGGALQDFIQQKLPFSLLLNEFARKQVSQDIAPWFVRNGIVADASEVDASTIKVTFNGVTASLPEWTLNVYRQAGDPFWGQGVFKKDAKFESTIGQDLSKLQSNETIKENLEGYLRRTYLGTQYIDQVNSLLIPTHPQQKPFQDLRVAKEISDLRVALEQGKATQYIQNADYQRIDRLLRALPAATSTSTGERIEYFAIGGTRIPGMYEITLVGRGGQSGVPKTSFVYMPDAPHGQSIFEKQDFIARLKESPSLQENLLSRALIKDRANVDNALRVIKNRAFSTNPKPIVGKFTQACDQLIKDKIDNADELTTSRLEMIGEQTWKGVGFALAPVCMMGGPVAVATCALGTTVLTTKDIVDISNKVARGQLDDALWDSAFIWADASDIAAGVKPLARGVKGLLQAVGKTHFSTIDEVTDAIKTVKLKQAGFLPNGHLNPRLAAVNVDDAGLIPRKPRQSLPGDFYAQNGKYYIKDGNHNKFEVYSDSGWMPDTIRVRDPHNPYAQGPLIHFKDGRWLKNEGGLLGGAPGIQNKWTVSYWKDGLPANEFNKAITNKKAFWNNYIKNAGAAGFKAKGEPRTLAQVVTQGQELLDNLAGKAQNLPQFKIYRTMDKSEAKGIFEWFKQKGEVETFIKGGGKKPVGADDKWSLSGHLKSGDRIMPAKNHLGDFDQANRYAGADNVMIEFTLKPGADELLFDPKYMAVDRRGGDATISLVMQQTKKVDNKYYPAAGGGEGALGGYIGVKSEEHGPFSLSLGKDSQPSQLLFQLFVDDIRFVDKTTGLPITDPVVVQALLS